MIFKIQLKLLIKLIIRIMSLILIYKIYQNLLVGFSNDLLWKRLIDLNVLFLLIENSNKLRVVKFWHFWMYRNWSKIVIIFMICLKAFRNEKLKVLKVVCCWLNKHLKNQIFNEIFKLLENWNRIKITFSLIIKIKKILIQFFEIKFKIFNFKNLIFINNIYI